MVNSKEEKNWSALLFLLFIPVAILTILFIQSLPIPPARPIRSGINPHLFFFAFVFLPFLVAIVLWLIMLIRTSRKTPRYPY